MRSMVCLQELLQTQVLLRVRIYMRPALLIFKTVTDKLNRTQKRHHCMNSNQVGPANRNDPYFTNVITALSFLMPQCSAYNKLP